MEKDENRTNLIIIIVLVIFLIGLFIFGAFHHFLSKNSHKLKKEESNEVVNPDTSVDTPISYGNYKVGDEVVLSDGSSWHVVTDSLEHDEVVELLKDEPIHVDNTNQKIDDYLQNIYIKLLISSLKIDNTDLQEIRLLSLEDIENVIGSSTLNVGDSLTSSQGKFLYQNSTVLRDVDENGNFLFICEEDLDGMVKICTKQEETLISVRPIISMKKSILN